MAIAGSKLFAPTLTSLAAVTSEVRKRHEVSVFAKHPLAHSLAPGLRIKRIDYLRVDTWPQHFDLTHLMAGDTAERILERLPRDFPVVITCEGGGDFTRRIQDPLKACSYERQFARAQAVVFIHESGARLAREHCALDEQKVRVFDPCLPLPEYPGINTAGNPPHVAVVGREVPEKGRASAEVIIAGLACVERALFVGAAQPGQVSDARFIYTGILDHAAYLEKLSQCRALLYVGATRGERYDTLPTTFLEAFALGIPVVSTPLVGVQRIAASFPEAVRLGDTADRIATHLRDVFRAAPDTTRLSSYARRRFGVHGLVDAITDGVYLDLARR